MAQSLFDESKSVAESARVADNQQTHAVLGGRLAGNAVIITKQIGQSADSNGGQLTVQQRQFGHQHGPSPVSNAGHVNTTFQHSVAKLINRPVSGLCLQLDIVICWFSHGGHPPWKRKQRRKRVNPLCRTTWGEKESKLAAKLGNSFLLFVLHLSQSIYFVEEHNCSQNNEP